MWNNNEYILKEGWANHLIDNNIHNNYINSHKLIKTCDEFHEVREAKHPVEFYIDQQQEQLLQFAQQLNSNITSYDYSVNCFLPGEELTIHNDYYDFNRDRPVRGICWLNPEPVQGTQTFNESLEFIGTLGGNPGDLFIFNTSETSHHGAENTTDINRYTVNFTFIIN